MMIFSRDSQDM